MEASFPGIDSNIFLGKLLASFLSLDVWRTTSNTADTWLFEYQNSKWPVKTVPESGL